MTVQELKARAYDILATIEHWQLELKRVNGEIAQKTEEEMKNNETKKEETKNDGK